MQNTSSVIRTGISIMILSLMGVLVGMRPTPAVPFKPPPENPTPPYGGGAGTRSGDLCLEEGAERSNGSAKVQSYALVPSGLVGLTITPNPTLMLYLQGHDPQQANFILRNAQGQVIYHTSMMVTGEAGVVTIALPDDVVLELNQDYQWYFALECPDSFSISAPISSWVRRIEPDSAMLTANEQPISIEKAIALGELGLWYDTLAVLNTVAPINEASPDSIHHWQELLQSVNLLPWF